MSEQDDSDKPQEQEMPAETPGEAQGEAPATPPKPPGDPLASGPPPYPDKDKTASLVQGFLDGEYATIMSVPWPLDRDMLRECLAEKAENRSLTVIQAVKLPVLVVAYLLEEFAPDARKGLLQKEGSGDDVLVSGMLCAAIGRGGADEHVRFAAEYYHHLLSLPHASDVLEGLVIVRDALGPSVTSQGLAAVMDKRAAALVKKEDLELQMEGRDLEDMRNNDLQEIDWADVARKRVLALDDPAKRLGALMDIYFERTGDGGDEYLVPWVVLHIRKHAHEHGAPSVVEALKQEVAKAAEKREKDEDARFVSIRAMRGLTYFREGLSEDDQEFFAEYSPQQMDPLSPDRLMPERYDVEDMD